MSTDPKNCAACGRPHLAYNGRPGCAAHKSGQPDTPCIREPIKGSTVCRSHGGGASQVKGKAQDRLEQQHREAVLLEGLAAAYGDDVPAIDPADAMLQAVSWKYAEVVALRRDVAALDDTERFWGVTREKDGGDDRGTTSEARPHVLHGMLRESERDLVKFAAAARTAGCDERRVQVAEDLGRQLARSMEMYGAARLAWVIATLGDRLPDGFVEMWQASAPADAAAAFRAIESGGPEGMAS